MARTYRSSVKCAAVGCSNYAHYEYSSRRDEEEGYKFLKKHPYRCTRHVRPSEVLTTSSLTRVQELTLRTHVRCGDKLFWTPEGSTSGSGFAYGPGFQAHGEDFPPGTKLIVTAEIVLPEESE